MVMGSPARKSLIRFAILHSFDAFFVLTAMVCQDTIYKIQNIVFDFIVAILRGISTIKTRALFHTEHYGRNVRRFYGQETTEDTAGNL